MYVVLNYEYGEKRILQLMLRNPFFRTGGNPRAELLYKIVTVQPAPFAKPHFVLIAAAAAVLLIYWRSAHLFVSRRILMQA